MSVEMKVPDGWETKSLAQYFKLKSGDTKPSDVGTAGIYKVYGGNGITGYSGFSNNDQETLVVGRVGEYCGATYLVKKCWITDNALYIEKKLIEFDSKYMFYLLVFLNLNQYKAETGQPLLNQTIIGNLQVSIPIKFGEQQRIAEILSTLDLAIEASQKLIAKEKNIKKGLMHDLLTNGIDKNGKIRNPKTHNYKESQLGLIPQEWEAVKLRDVTKAQQGLQIPITERHKQRGENLYPYLTIQSIKKNDDFEYIMNPKKSVICSKEDVLMTRTGNTGSVVTGISGVFHNNFFSIDFDRKKINKSFLVYFLNSEKVQQEIQLKSGITTIPDLNHGDFYSIDFMAMDIDEQLRITNILTTQDKKIQTEKEHLSKLKELKKGLMNDLLSGKVRV